LSKLTWLTRLNVRRFASLPLPLPRRLPSTPFVQLSDNRIETLPASMTALQSLTELNVRAPMLLYAFISC